MEQFNQPTLWACCGACIALGVSMKYVIDRLKTLGERSHTYGNSFADHERRLIDIERRLEKMGNGDH